MSLLKKLTMPLAIVVGLVGCEDTAMNPIKYELVYRGSVYAGQVVDFNYKGQDHQIELKKVESLKEGDFVPGTLVRVQKADIGYFTLDGRNVKVIHGTSGSGGDINLNDFDGNDRGNLRIIVSRYSGLGLYGGDTETTEDDSARVEIDELY